MENRGYSIYEVGILGGNDKGEIKFILFLMFYSLHFSSKNLKLQHLSLVLLESLLVSYFYIKKLTLSNNSLL